MRIKFWGVRGSIPVPGSKTLKYGGNTSCIEINTDDEQLIILDAGTGIRNLGIELNRSGKPVNAHILFSHYHSDHLQGLPFFLPIYKGGNAITLIGPTQAGLESSFSGVRDVIESFMDGVIFPFRRGSLEYLSEIKYIDIGEGEFKIGQTKITAIAFNHTIYDLGYKIESNNKSVVYSGDHEPYKNIFEGSDDEVGATRIFETNKFIEKMNSRIINFIKGVDLFICDSQYTEEEYEKYKGWGHSSMEETIKLAVSGNVKRLILTHHDPQRADEELDALEIELKKFTLEKLNSNLDVSFAREGSEIIL